MAQEIRVEALLEDSGAVYYKELESSDLEEYADERGVR